MHFEELWEKCEQANNSDSSESSHIIDELVMKVAVYQAINSKKELSDKDKKETKEKVMGEILFTLTNLSLKDEINVFKALFVSLKERLT